MTKNLCCASSFDLTKGMHSSIFVHHWPHVMPTAVPMLHLILIILTKTSAVVPLMRSLALQDKKSNVASHFDHLDLTYGNGKLMTWLESSDTDISINGITWPRKLYYTLYQLSGPNEYNGAINNAIDITWCWCQCQVSNNWKCQVTSCFDHLELTNGMLLLRMPSVSCDTTVGITWSKIHVAPCFNHLELANKMVPLTMLSVACDAHMIKRVMSHLL